MSARREWLDLGVYAEERDQWTPSYRADIDRRLRVGDGDEQRLKLTSGSVVVGVWNEGPSGSGWADEAGDPIENIEAVELAPR